MLGGYGDSRVILGTEHCSDGSAQAAIALPDGSCLPYHRPELLDLGLTIAHGYMPKIDCWHYVGVGELLAMPFGEGPESSQSSLAFEIWLSEWEVF